MFDWIILFGWLLPPVVVPTVYYAVRRTNIGKPIRFLFHACCMAILLYWLLALPLAVLLWWFLVPDFMPLRHIYAMQALVTMLMLWALVRAERRQQAAETNEIFRNISNSIVRNKWKMIIALLVFLFCAHQLIGHAIYRTHAGAFLPPGVIITSWSETPRMWLGDGTAHVFAFGSPWAIKALLSAQLLGRSWSRGGVPVRVYWEGADLQCDDDKLFIQNVRQTDDNGAMWNGEVVVVYPHYCRIKMISYDF